MNVLEVYASCMFTSRTFCFVCLLISLETVLDLCYLRCCRADGELRLPVRDKLDRLVGAERLTTTGQNEACWFGVCVQLWRMRDTTRN